MSRSLGLQNFHLVFCVRNGAPLRSLRHGGVWVPIGCLDDGQKLLFYLPL